MTKVKIPQRNHIYRFETYLNQKGTKRDIIKNINNFVLEVFKESRDNYIALHDIDLKRIAIDYSSNFNTNFKASDSWLYKFKKKNTKLFLAKSQNFLLKKSQR